MKSHQYLQDMATFVAVAKHKSFSRAAVELDVPTSSVSRQIAQMEKRLSLKLFHRTSRSVTLTPTGVDYFAQAQQVIDAAQEVYAQVLGQNQLMRGRIRISASITVAHDYLAPYICWFAKKYPEVDIELEASQRYVDMHAEGFDLVLRLASQPLRDSDLIAKPLLHLSHGLYASPSYLAAFHGATDAATIRIEQHCCLALSAKQTDWQLQCDDDGQKIRLMFQPRYVLGSMELLHQAAVSGLGLACLGNTPQVAQDVQEQKLVRLLPNWRTLNTTLYAMTTARAQPQRVRVFLNELSNFCTTVD
ncbi:MAG: LysR substrate-binding domain-containing protein [Formosimonas sp.]